MTPTTFAQTNLTKDYHVLHDEFHNDMFDEGTHTIVPALRQSKTLFATTGAPLLLA